MEGHADRGERKTVRDQRGKERNLEGLNPMSVASVVTV